MAVKPFSPDEALEAMPAVIPDQVIEAVNELLASRWRNGGYITLTQTEVMERASMRLTIAGIEHKRDDFFDKHWLDFEALFEKVGWKVYHDKPAYNENYEPTFKFWRK